ncbi:hypothetical protein EK21DRAFT_94952 [Setomelanomma holmii]|uniref:Uncharacterized protein n=1 Tax=Setomelanomma holmii TaxID=210430 RepID=A0A9P4GXM7_9PLEO|nr:hypothetical protein EK21DRAFT_94952 [Setomelanomma holmii]
MSYYTQMSSRVIFIKRRGRSYRTKYTISTIGLTASGRKELSRWPMPSRRAITHVVDAAVGSVVETNASQADDVCAMSCSTKGSSQVLNIRRQVVDAKCDATLGRSVGSITSPYMQICRASQAVMQSKFFLLVATSLVALISATATGHDGASLSLTNADVVNPAIDVREVQGDVVTASAPPDQCELNCHLAWRKCVRDCGGGSFCEHKCSYTLFSNPKQLCRVRRCVAAPDKCPARKDSRDIIDNPSSDVAAEPQPLPINSCFVCSAAVNSCAEKCGRSEDCKRSCKCSQKGPSTFCKECHLVKCEPQGRDTTDRLDSEAPTESNVEFVGVPNPCVVCLTAIKPCNNKCTTPGGCGC